MKKHTRIYFAHFGYDIASCILCENCHKPATSIHHIQFRSQGGGNDITNLMALCTDCHDTAHNSTRQFNDELKRKHLELLKTI